MLKKWLSLVLLAGLVGCSGDSPKSLSEDLSSVEELSQLVVAEGSGVFGSVLGSQVQVLVIANTGNSLSEVPSPVLTGEDANAFSIIHTNGCATGLINSARCYIRISFNSVGKSSGSYSATLTVGLNLEIPLSATVAESATANYQVLDNGVPLSSLNFGNISRTQAVSKMLSIKNVSSVNSPPLSLALSNSYFSLAANSCQGKVLKPNQSCSVKVQFSTLGQTPALYLADLEFAAEVLPLSGTILSVPPAGEEGSGVEIETFVNNEALTNEDLNLGIFPNNLGVVKVITFKNNGDFASEPLTASLNDSSNFSLVSNGCQNKVLAPGATCTLRLIFSAVGKLAGDYSVSLTFAGNNPEWSAAVLGSNSCPNDFHLVSPVCINDYQGCDYEHGTGQQHWQGNAYGSCYAVACESGYDLVDQQCLLACSVGSHRNYSTAACDPDVIDCVGDLAHATSATRTWNGSAYGACIAQACENPYHVESGLCVDDVADCTAELPKATSASKTWNGSAYGACLALTCEEGYNNVTTMCSPTSPATASVSYTTAGSYQFEIPAGVHQIMVVAAGGGGGGGGSNLYTAGGSGGGGAANYSRELMQVVPGEIYDLVVANSGSGGSPGSGGGGTGGTSSISKNSSLLFSWSGGNGGGPGYNGGSAGGGGSGSGNGGSGGNGGGPYSNGSVGHLGSLTIFSGVTAGDRSGPWYSGGGGGGGGAGLGSGGTAAWVGVNGGTSAGCGGGGGGTGGNDNGGGNPGGLPGGAGCVHIYYNEP